MNELEKKLQALKEELDRKREEIADLKKLTGREIDRRFPASLEDLSDKELGDYLRDTLSEFNDLTEARPDIRAVAPSRRMLGRPIAFLKRKLLETTFIHLDVFLDKQIGFNRQAAALIRILHRRLVERSSFLEGRIAELEEDSLLVRDRLNEIESRLR